MGDKDLKIILGGDVNRAKFMRAYVKKRTSRMSANSFGSRAGSRASARSNLSAYSGKDIDYEKEIN